MGNINKDELNLISMNVILHAGNAKELIFEAIDAASKKKYSLAEELVVEANNEMTLAHKTQTSMLQQEAEGIEIPYSPLFVHAQDTLMTTKSEISILKEIIKIYKKLGG